VPARYDEHLVQVTVRETAVESEGYEPRAAGRVVPGVGTAGGDQRDGDG
jgi:hypothetical protein